MRTVKYTKTHTPNVRTLRQTLNSLVFSCSGCRQAVRADLQTCRLSLLRPPSRESPRWDALRQHHLQRLVRGGEVPGECI